VKFSFEGFDLSNAGLISLDLEFDFRNFLFIRVKDFVKAHESIVMQIIADKKIAVLFIFGLLIF
jgi:hypothetical protein